MIVNVNAIGEFYVGGERHSEAELSARLRRARVDNPDNQSVVIRGSEGADWKYVAQVMGLCNETDINDYRVAVIPEDGAP